MLDIKDIKTRDIDSLNESLREIIKESISPNIKIQKPLSDCNLLFDLVEKMQCDTMIFFDREIHKWVFTDVYDEYLVSQDFFKRENFVIVETDLPLALARGIHYRYHKKLRE